MIGTILSDRYEITGELGRGGMGVVYKALDPLLNREVAIKMIPPTALDTDSEARFQEEARLVAKLDHPAIVPIHDLGQHDGALYLVMPLVQGTSLDRLIHQGSLSLGDILEIGVQCAGALAYSHSRGIIHRDVKPSNIIVSQQGAFVRIRIMDFGLARHQEDRRRTRTGSLPGTLAYLSPEQVAEEHSPADARSDIYGLGTVLYECLAGEPPFSGPLFSTLFRIIQEPPRGLRGRGLKVDEELEQIILRCLYKEPDLRPQTGTELAEILNTYGETLSDPRLAMPMFAETTSEPRSRPPRPEHLRLVGREKELAALQERLRRALEGECQLVVIGGDAGTGKSHLLEEIEGLARNQRLRVLRGRFSDWETSFPHQGLCELIQDFYRSGDSTTSSTAPLPEISDLYDDLVALFPALSEILDSGKPGPHAQPPQSSAKSGVRDPTFVFELLARTLTRLAGGRPMVLLLENLHAANASLDALRYLVRRLGMTPTLIIGTYRESEVFRGHPLLRTFESFADDPRFERWVLEPLSVNEVRRLIEQLIGSSMVTVDLVERIYAATEGNPLFCRELVHSLRDMGAIERDGSSGIWSLSERAALSAGSLPATIQQAEERRLERLTADQRRVLSIASVLGKSFEYSDLEELVGEKKDLDDIVDELLMQGLLREGRQARGDRLSFTTGIIRDLLYQDLARRRRRSLHRKFAKLLEKRHHGRLERVYPQLVNHYQAADVAAKTVRYGLALAQQSLESFSPEDAITAARTALEFIDDEDIEEPERREAELSSLLARAHRALGHHERSIRLAERAFGLLRGHTEARNEAAETALMAAEIAWHGRRMDLTRQWVDLGAQAAREAGATSVLRRLLNLGATVANLRGGTLESMYSDELRQLDADLAARADQGGHNEPGGHLISAIPNPVATVDPGAVETLEEWEVAASSFETLLAATSDGIVEPALCQSWRPSSDHQTFTLKLRGDARFADGSLVDAAAIKSAIERTAQLRSASLPPALAAISGTQAFLAGESTSIAGIEVPDDKPSDSRLIFHLRQILPIFPALLTDLRMAIAKPAHDGQLQGTGPFRFLPESQPDRWLLARNPHWRGSPAPLEKLEFRILEDAATLAQRLREGEVHLGRDLLPGDLEELLRQPRFRFGLVETVKKNVYFALFHQQGPLSRHLRVRRALAGVVRTGDLVWRTLGRFAIPAVGLIPPGILGHDANRKRPTVSRERALDWLRNAGFDGPLRLRAAIHPLFNERYGPLLAALRDEWAAIGVDIESVTPDMASFIDSWRDNKEFDLVIGRWSAAYDDPDNFTYALFDSKAGQCRNYFHSAVSDQLFAQARQQENARSRVGLYQDFEDLLQEEAILLPLFHDIDYRLVTPGWGGLKLRTAAPYVDYSSIVKRTDVPAGTEAFSTGGELRVPTSGLLQTLDPSDGQLLDHHEIIPTVFETLLRLDRQTRILPWLAEAFESEAGGRIYRFRLRPDLRFHDGRRLTSHDVQYSFERLLKRQDNNLHTLLLPIHGARSLSEGRADSLDGFKILSPTEFVLELHRPLAFFPALLTHPGCAIVPEGLEQFDTTWKDGCCGTGPFRVVGLARGDLLDLERNPFYWRSGHPKCDRLRFQHRSSPEQIRDDFLAGRLSLASGLKPEDIESLRREPGFDGDYLESPSLSSYFLLLNACQGPLADDQLRRELGEALRPDSATFSNLGRLVIRSHGLLPPGLLGFEALPASQRSAENGPSLDGTRLRLACHPAYALRYPSLPAWIRARLREFGAEVEYIECDVSELLRLGRTSEVDLLLGRWVAVYTDADCFLSGVFDSPGCYAGLAKSAELDGLIEKGRLETDPALRHGIYRNIENHLAQRNLLVPMFHEQTYRFAQAAVRGLRLGITVPEIRYDELYLE